MRRFFIALFVVSLCATAATLYWRTYYPEHVGRVAESRPAPRSTDQGGGPTARSLRSERGDDNAPSQRQDLSVTISILSSVISALAAVLQTWLTARAFRRQ